jgi:formyl-CoA transferase
VGVANDKFWGIFCAALGRPDLRDDPRFDTAPKRASDRAALVELIAPVFATRTGSEWLATLTDADIPCGAIKTVRGLRGATARRARHGAAR